MQPLPPDVILIDEQPLVQLDVFHTMVLMTRRHPNGSGWRTYPVSPEALQQTLGKLPASTGLLPAGTLGSGFKNGEPFYVQLLAPRVVTLAVMIGEHEQTYEIQTPPLVWAGWKSDYRIWALASADWPTRGNVSLWKAPFPNCYEDGAICWGDSDRPPVAGPATLQNAFDLFISGSRFNAHVANGKSVSKPANVINVYPSLGPEIPYPVDDLMPAELHLGWVLAGSCWRG